MEKFLWLLMTVLLLSGCVGESDYESRTGTFSIPWGEKEGKNVPPPDELHAPMPSEIQKKMT